MCCIWLVFGIVPNPQKHTHSSLFIWNVSGNLIHKADRKEDISEKDIQTKNKTNGKTNKKQKNKTKITTTKKDTDLLIENKMKKERSRDSKKNESY